MHSIVSFIADNGCEVVGRYYGETEYNGITYALVSPYGDDRPRHWVSPPGKVRKLGFFVSDPMTNGKPTLLTTISRDAYEHAMSIKREGKYEANFALAWLHGNTWSMV